MEDSKLNPDSCNKHWDVLLLAYLALFGAFCLFIGIVTKFHAGHNDFLWNLFMAQRLNLHEPSSFYNGFFPFGYPVFLKLFSFGHPFVSAYIANVLFGLVLLGSIGYLTSRTIGPGWGILCVVPLSLTPKVLTYATTPGPDMGTAAFIAAATTLLIISFTHELTTRRTITLIIVSGLLFGLSSLWRYNGLPLAVGFIVASAMVSRKYVSYLVLGLSSLFLVYSVQWLVNRASGHGLMETATNFNVYITMYGIDWEKVSSLRGSVPHSTFHIITSAPGRFLRSYFQNFSKFITVLLPSFLGMILLKDAKQIRVSAIIFLASLFYFSIVTIGAGQTHRADLPAIPFSAYQIIVLTSFACGIASQIYSRARFRIAVISLFVIVLGWIFVSYARQAHALITERKNDDRTFQSIQAALLQDGVTSSRQVFSTNYDLYFPAIKPYQPYNNGDWARYSMFNLDEEYPELATQDLNAFLSDCRRHGITHIVLDDTADDLSPDLGRVYTEELQPAQLHKITQAGEMKLFEITGS